MADFKFSKGMTAIIGTGVTGLSVARFLKKLNRPFMFFDTREAPPNQLKIEKEFPAVSCQYGHWGEFLCTCGEIILSPGVSRKQPEIIKAESVGVAVLGDVQLFLAFADAPIIAITGSNAKSTVTTWVGEMACAANIDAAVGGNLGVPVFDLLDDHVALYVLELSSFQLELIDQLNANVACILNISEDHLDRYANMSEYCKIKQRIYTSAKAVVFNNNDSLTAPAEVSSAAKITFGGAPRVGDMATLKKGGVLWLADGSEALMPVSELKISGRHNIDNALAALAIGKAFGLPMEAMLASINTFEGLPHRCQWVGECNGVSFFNDSKGTNVGATVAAVKGLDRRPHKLILIMGGEGKGADFNSLRLIVENVVKAVILIGRDGPLIAKALSGVVKLYFSDAMNDAVCQAFSIAVPNDAVVLSPACASFDMFESYQHRGDEFCRAVKEVCHG